MNKSQPFVHSILATDYFQILKKQKIRIDYLGYNNKEINRE